MVKNRLALKALDAAEGSEYHGLFKGPVGIAYADDAVTAVKDRPAMAAGIATAAALFIARKPLFAAVARWFGEDTVDDPPIRKRSRKRVTRTENIDA